MSESKRIVHGVGCTWWDTIDNAGKKQSGLPCCPHCGSVLFESSIEEWDSGVRHYEAHGNPGYAEKVAWMRGKCFANIGEAYAAFAERDEP